MSKITFIILALICFGCLLNRKKAREHLLFLLSFYFIFNLGWVFYHYTGIMLVDFPIVALIVLGHISKGQFRYFFSQISAPAICLIIWGIITSLLAIEVGWAFAELSMILRGYLVFLCVANHLKKIEDLKALLNGFTVGIILEFLMSIWQWRIGPTPLLPLVNETFHNWRATGTFYVPHYLGNYLLLVMPIFFRLFLYYKAPTKIVNIRYGAIFGISLLTFFLTFARGPWIGFAGSITIVCVLSLLKSKYRLRAKWAIGLLMVGAGAFLIQYSSTIIDQFGAGRSDAATIRYDQFRTARRVIADNLIFGTGLGNYELISPKYVYDYEKADPRSWQFSEMVHNSYYFLAAQLGIPGIIFFFWGAFLVFRKGFKVIKSKIPFFLNLSIGIITGFLGLGIAFLVGPDVKSYHLLVHIGINVGILIGLNNLERSFREKWMVMNQSATPQELQAFKRQMEKSLAY